MTDDFSRDALAMRLEALGVPYELFPCDPALADTAAFCEAYGFDPDQSANTILVIGKSDSPRYAACVVLALLTDLGYGAVLVEATPLPTVWAGRPAPPAPSSA